MYSILFCAFIFVTTFAQDCLLKVPQDPLNKGLFTPWILSTKVGSDIPCTQTNPNATVFVEATIVDSVTGQLFVYYPLVVDAGTNYSGTILSGPLPVNPIVVLHFGTNGNSLTLVPTKDSSGYDSMNFGNCVNGLPEGTIFGQFAYCNAVNFFRNVNKLILAKKIIVPPLQNSLLGDICPTTRSFAVVDQDQSDNVISQYLLINNINVVQDYPVFRTLFPNATVEDNGSDNRLLADFIDVAIGCQPFMAPDLIITTILRQSLALNEIQANLNNPTLPTTALVPPNDPMVLDNGVQSLLKLNLYRVGVNQPPLIALIPLIDLIYCKEMALIAPVFFKLHLTELTNFVSPAPIIANNLLNFLANRFSQSWTNLQCQILTGNPSPITVTIDPVTNIVIGNNLFIPTTTLLPSTFISTTTFNPYAIPTTSGIGNLPSTVSTSNLPSTVSTSNLPSTLTSNLPLTNVPSTLISNTSTVNLCGSSFTNVNCTQPCPSGLNSDCPTPFSCFLVSSNDTSICNIHNFCGDINGVYNCSSPCPLGIDMECQPGLFCYKLPQTLCNSTTQQQQQNPIINEGYSLHLSICTFFLTFSYMFFSF